MHLARAVFISVFPFVLSLRKVFSSCVSSPYHDPFSSVSCAWSLVPVKEWPFPFLPNTSLESPAGPCYTFVMNIHFSPEAAKREQTPLDNLFIAEYMPDCPEDALKVYLYGLMQCHFPSMAEADLAASLFMTDCQVLTAFVYWQSRGLVRILSDAPLEVEYLTVEQPAATTATPMKYAAFVRSLNSLIAPRTFTLREMKHIYDIIETFHLEESTVLELVAWCMENKGRNVSIQYILTVGKSWAERGITTPQKAQEYIHDATAKKHGAGEILRRWNKRRSPTQDEMDLYEKWVKDWGFDQEAILAVCPQLTGVSTPTFEILGERLEELRDKNLITKTDIEKQQGYQSGEREFARQVFATMGKVEPPTKTEIAHLAAYCGSNGLPREVILLAAEDCQGADRPFGKLKTILSDWMNRGIRTKEDAQKALSSPATPARSYRNTKNAYAAGYAQHASSNFSVDDISLDLDSDL